MEADGNLYYDEAVADVAPGDPGARFVIADCTNKAYGGVYIQRIGTRFTPVKLKSYSSSLNPIKLLRAAGCHGAEAAVSGVVPDSHQ